MSGMRKTRTCLAVTALAMGLLAGCSSSGGDEEPIDTGDSSSKNPANEETQDTAADEAALKQLFLDYWAAMVKLENSKAIDPTVFEGLAASGVRERETSRVQQFKDYGMIRRGEPEITRITPEVDGDRARVEACVNSDTWRLYDEDGEEVPTEGGGGPVPSVVIAEKQTGGWLVTEHPSGKTEASISC